MYDIGIGFSFCGVHCSEFHCELANNDECMHAITDVFTAGSESIDGYKGEFYTFDSVKGKEFEIKMLVEDITDNELAGIGAWVNSGASGQLIFDHMPYKYYNVRSMNEPKMDLHNGYDHEKNLYTYSGTITVKFKAYTPRAYMVDEIAEAYPDNIGNLLNTIEAGTGIVPQDERLSAFSTSDFLVANFGNASAASEIWLSGTFKSGTTIKNKATGQAFVICAPDYDSVVVCVDAALGRTYIVTGVSETPSSEEGVVSFPTTKVELAIAHDEGKFKIADDIKSGNFIEISPCFPRWRKMEFIKTRAQRIQFSENASTLMKGKYAYIQETGWNKITAVNMNTNVVALASDITVSSGTANILQLNPIGISCGENDVLTGISVFCKDTFY